MTMKLERRGKYPGVKVHLEPEECSAVTDDVGICCPPIIKKLRKLIKRAMKDDPSLFDDRTDDEIREELEVERDKSIEKLEKLNGGGKWNE